MPGWGLFRPPGRALVKFRRWRVAFHGWMPPVLPPMRRYSRLSSRRCRLSPPGRTATGAEATEEAREEGRAMPPAMPPLILPAIHLAIPPAMPPAMPPAIFLAILPTILLQAALIVTAASPSGAGIASERITPVNNYH